VSKDRRLGRGLAALLGAPLFDEQNPSSASGAPTSESPRIAPTSFDASTPASFSPTSPSSSPEKSATENGGLLQLAVDEIEENPFQPRRDFSEAEIASLAESLKEHDMLQPVLVRRVNGRYQLISGERRLRASKLAGWKTIPARVREADDRLVAELAIVENLQRQDLNPIEKALSFKRYLDEHRCSQEDLARRLKIDRSTIANLMRLLELPQTVLDCLRNGIITAGHARALLPLGDDREQIEMCGRIGREELSVRDVERMVGEKLLEEDGEHDLLPGPGSETKRKKKTSSEQVAALEQELRLALGMKVEIKQSSAGKGKLVIHFLNHDEFESLHTTLTDSLGGGGLKRAA
jgi:ParB family transcriptional regulator, chromosome partitioning protein